MLSLSEAGARTRPGRSRGRPAPRTDACECRRVAQRRPSARGYDVADGRVDIVGLDAHDGFAWQRMIVPRGECQHDRPAWRMPA